MAIDQKSRGLLRPGSGGRKPHASPKPSLSQQLSQLPQLGADDDDPATETWDEFTPILDTATLYKKVAQTASMVKHVIDVVPKLEGKVGLAVDAARGAHEAAKAAHDAAAKAQNEAFDAKTTSVLVQQRVEDLHHRVECLEPVKVNGATAKVRLDGLEEREEERKHLDEEHAREAHASRRWLIGLLMGLIVTGLGSLGAAVWWAGQHDSAATHETERREAADRALDAKLAEQLANRPTRDEVLTRNELKALRDELARARRPTVDEWIESLPPSKRAAARKLVIVDPEER